MVRGYERLVDSDTEIDVNMAMAAAGRLQAMIESRAGEMSMAEVMVKLGRVIEAVRSTVPREMWPEINRKIEGDDETVEPAVVERTGGPMQASSPSTPTTSTASRVRRPSRTHRQLSRAVL